MASDLSRAHLEALDRDELVDVVLELAGRVDDLESEVTILKEKNQRASDVRTNIWADLDTLTDRVDALDAENQRLRDRLDETNGKAAKVRAIVQYADRVRNGDPAVKLTAKEIQGAADCSRRYAYDLMDDLPREYDWFLTPQEMAQYGSLEIDNGDERRLGVDFEGVHSAGCPLNKFTTRDGREGGE